MAPENQTLSSCSITGVNSATTEKYDDDNERVPLKSH